MKEALVKLLVPLMLAMGLVGQAKAKDLVDNFDVFSKAFINKQPGTAFAPSFDFELSAPAYLLGNFSSNLGVSFTRFDIVDRDFDNDSIVVSTSPSPVFSFFLPDGNYELHVAGTILSNLAGFTGLMSAGLPNAPPVPEPAEWMMIIAGVSMMGFVVSRRRNIG